VIELSKVHSAAAAAVLALTVALTGCGSSVNPAPAAGPLAAAAGRQDHAWLTTNAWKRPA